MAPVVDEIAMAGDRSRYGLLVSALGAVLLAVSVFLPWYGISLTNAGVTLAQQAGDHLVAQYGNAALQAQIGGFHGALQSLAGVQLGSVSGHDATKAIAVVLLILAALGMLDAMLPLARAGGAPQGAGGAVVLLGLIAAAFVLFRMISPPSPAGDVLALSLREGTWMALFGSLMMALGGLWPRAIPALGLTDGGEDVFASLSGWTPS
ncbi:MAG TPA: hypothetical protein VGD00_02720 [Solirubrobacteraceae bacterium]|jgi:hypothetical protein